MTISFQSNRCGSRDALRDKIDDLRKSGGSEAAGQHHKQWSIIHIWVQVRILQETRRIKLSFTAENNA
jgi:N-methylhydantoinase B/oxoprolinase/acetone carboxylase alpha subunit